MATTKITDLTAYTDPVNTDVLPIVDVTSDVTKKVSIANVMKNASQGTAAAPGIAFDGDSNTGIYSPGANQVAITTDGTQRLLIDSAGAVTIAGDLTVNGTTTNINTQNLIVEDKNVVLGDVAVPTDVTADGGGITLKGTTDKTINWVDSTDAWTSSENVDLASGKSYRINGTEVLSATALGSAVQISSSNIPSGTIVNDDVNASAAIAGTKISPDFGSQTVQTTGIFSHALGTAGAPTVTFTGDSNTGIYSPGADQVAISTGGSGRLFVDASGNVGVGTSAPENYGSGFATLEARGLSGTAGGVFQTRSFDTSIKGYFYVDSSTNTGRIGTVTNHPFLLVTNSQERLRVTSAGLVGVGVSSPSELLHLGSGGKIRLNRADNATGSTISDGGSNNGIIFNSLNNDGFTFQNAGTTVFKIDTSTNGNRVGIGASSPGAKLEVLDSRNSTLLRLNAQGGEAWDFKNTNTAGSTDVLTIGAAGATANLALDDTGRVGIGTQTPQAKIVASNGGAEGIELYPAYNAGHNFTLHINRSGSAYVTNSQVASAHIFRISSDSTEAARIDSSSRLLVGTSSTSATNTALLQGNSGGSSNAGILHLAVGATTPADGSNCGRIHFSDSNHTTAASIAAQRDGGTWTSNTSMPTRLVFSTTADGASSPTERMKINNTGSLTVNGATSVAGGTHTIQDSGSSPNTVRLYNNTDSNNTINRFLICDAGASVLRAEIRSNGGLANYSANNANLSDRNAKKDISPAAGTWDCIKEWEIVNYRYKDQPDDADLNLGVIAQQVAESCPEVITVFEEAKDDQPEKLGIKEQQMYWMAIKALQEAQVRIEQLEAEVAALKAQ